jgi:hypothetical protein
MTEQLKRFQAIFKGLDIAYGTYIIKSERNDGKQAGKATVVRKPPPRTYGKSIWLVLSLPLELFLYVLIIAVYGAVLTLTNILWTIRGWWKRLRS